MIPRILPSSTRKSIPSNATVVPKALRRPRASMQAIRSEVLLLRRFGVTSTVEEVFRFEAEPLNGCLYPRPLFGEKFLAFAFQQQSSRAVLDVHTETSLFLHQFFVDQFLITL